MATIRATVGQAVVRFLAAQHSERDGVRRRLVPGVAGVGDSVGDAPWLAACGVSFAPANAVGAVREVVTHASALPDVAAVLEAYEALVMGNRRLVAG